MGRRRERAGGAANERVAPRTRVLALRSFAALVALMAVVASASGIGGPASASALSDNWPSTGASDDTSQSSPLDDLLAEESPALTDESTPHSITLDDEGNLLSVVEIEAIMPVGVTVNGHEIDISELVTNGRAVPILEGNPQWFIELEATPRMGSDAQLSGSSVIEYSESGWGVNPELVDAVRVVEQGRQEIIVQPDGSELSGCYFVNRTTVGKQAEISLVEISFDPDTCKRVVEFGILSDPPSTGSASVSSDDSGHAPLTVSSSEHVGPISSDGSSPLNGLAPGSSATSGSFSLEVPDYKAKTRAQVREPAYPVLSATSEVHAEVEVWNQQPQYSPSTWRWWSNWLQETGWRRIAHDAWGTRSDNNITVGESSDYENRVFANVACSRIWYIPGATGTTFAGHNVQTVGYANMTVDHFASSYKGGGCSFLLRTNKTDNFWWINET